ncbi:leukocyte tyrosine kinase receptor-like isoform X1 [Dermacentor albipictus]|uniref:leukocyte tyrosine kinase receptor-like isoform X1 n=2 Tax=Dermacentor albipictus TaxID=60249 RepID=UPI0038FCDD75
MSTTRRRTWCARRPRQCATSVLLVGLATAIAVVPCVVVAQDPPHYPARQFRITTTTTSTTTTTAAPASVALSPASAALRCDFEEPCGWTWNAGFALASASNSSDVTAGRAKGPTPVLRVSSPAADSARNVSGHFLYYGVREGAAATAVPGNVSSPWLRQAALQRCTLVFDMHASNMADGAVAVLLTNPNHTWEVRKVPGNSLGLWQTFQAPLGRQEPPFVVTVEVLPGKSAPGHLALDGIRLDNCVEQPRRVGSCLETQFRCSNSTCIDRQEVCDVRVNCADGEDEKQGCEQVPRGARCSFEELDGEMDSSDPTICGWRNKLRTGSGEWRRVAAANATSKYAPMHDHTTDSSKGHYICASGKAFGHAAVLESPEFPKLPYYHMNHTSVYFNSCHVRLHHYADRTLRPYGLTLYAVERDPRHASGLRHELWSASIKDDAAGTWTRVVRALPALRHPFTMQLAAQSAVRRWGCIAVDDLTLGPECFGIGVPENETREYPTDTSNDDAILEAPPPEKIYEGNITKSYGFGSCGVRGRFGPTPADCAAWYANSSTRVAVLTKKQQAGVQVWTVPDSGVYTVFVRGARGGLGLSRACNTSGALIRATFRWEHGDRIHIIAGQRGTDACEQNPNPRIQDSCSKTNKRSALENIQAISRGGGGGGGGASAIFRVDTRTGDAVPLVVAAGGGGHSAAAAASAGAAYAGVAGRGFQDNQPPGNGLSAPEGKGPGGGGGWNDSAAAESSATDEPTAGRPLMDGAAGGSVCAEAALWNTAGGFGGGGGGCAGGGGGGGWKGGDAAVTDTAQRSGHGGTSYVHPSRLEAAFLPTPCRLGSAASTDADDAKPHPGKGLGDAMVVIVSATDVRCPCRHFCLTRTLSPATFKCACPVGFRLARDGHNCHAASGDARTNGEYKLPTHHLVVIILCILVTVAIILFFVVGFPRCPGSRKKLPSSLSPEPLGGNNPEVQLSRLRQATGMVTEFNPNYEFGGSTCTLQDLTDIPRESLTLVKALGQGAFGEVYQGFLLPTTVPPTSPTTGEAPSPVTEIPVAVKTLPELSSPESEKDFVTEACIMSKFNHPNIVRFIGVCFEKMPRFIVLELLPGGDLKSFLRESRPKPSVPPSLTMTDLLKLAIDVAKGCQYLEDKHFIHRDIAARNCLLTTKAPGRVVKIADFGMARDIYRADYYRKGGKAMLPVKWMPPEAFLDGMFTSKTDVWSFGVLLWEVMSMGYMPYPGRGNQEVMQLVTSGGRLEPPANCPGPVYHVMTQCWHATPEERPSFGTILERLGYCIQDPDVVSAPLPVFHRPPSMERDATVMRPPNADNVCLQVYRSERSEVQSPGSEDYLIPMPSSNYSLSTERTELQSASSSLDSMDKLLGGNGNQASVKPSAPDKTTTWETSFTTTPPDELPIRAPLQQPYSNVALNC